MAVEIAGIDIDRVTAWVGDHLETVGPLSFTRLQGGHSNLTYRVDDAAGRRFVLRRPPLGHLLPTAHDMGREYRIIDALGPTTVPVPTALAHCTDTEISGAPFYLMAWVDGVVMHSKDVAEQAFPEEVRMSIGRSFIETLATLHAVDVDEVGLGDLSKKGDYIKRQLKTWRRQYEASKTDEDLVLEAVYHWLVDNVPEQPKVSVVHGDFRLGNCLTGADCKIAAVLDWEIATLGDPLADLGYVLATWPEPNDGVVATTSSPSMAAGFPSRAQVKSIYAEATGTDLTTIDYYEGWANWKSACIVQGVYKRYTDGALDTTGIDVPGFRVTVSNAADNAALAIGRVDPSFTTPSA
jgi:aminoglycoside phosphotransferase (APT) family kinase protein